jgi:glycosyltransferase involved in cell wall biosynthesis
MAEAIRPKVTVLVITYNHERYIASALAGALSQKTSFDFEILVADDCSTDKTADR